VIEWYLPRDIIFNLEQVKWLLSWLYVMVEGNWPADPQGSGYTDIASVQKSRSSHAPFEVACQIAAELEARLKMTGRDGEMLRAHYCDCWDYDRIASLSGIDINQVIRRKNSALWYCVGRKRKRITYKDFKKRGHYLRERKKG